MRLTRSRLALLAAAVVLIPCIAEAKTTTVQVDRAAGLAMCGIRVISGDASTSCTKKCGGASCNVDCEKAGKPCTLTITYIMTAPAGGARVGNAAVDVPASLSTPVPSKPNPRATKPIRGQVPAN